VNLPSGGARFGSLSYLKLKLVTNLVTFLYICRKWQEMNIYNRNSLITFYNKHSDCKDTLEKWYHDVSSKTWKTPGDITRDFNTARTVANNRAVFKFIGTHKAYDKVNAETVDHFKPKPKK
jgi:mRNA interferase HigB